MCSLASSCLSFSFSVFQSLSVSSCPLMLTSESRTPQVNSQSDSFFNKGSYITERGFVRSQVPRGWLVSGWKRFDFMQITSNSHVVLTNRVFVPSRCCPTVWKILALSSTPNCMPVKWKRNVAQEKVSKNVANRSEMKVSRSLRLKNEKHFK